VPLLATDISVGDHIQRHFLGLTINIDTVWATAAALLVVLGITWAVRRQARQSAGGGVPGRLQVAWEVGIQAVTQQIEGSIGERGLVYVPLALSLFLFILICNFFEVFGLGGKYELLAVPTADINLPLAMALLVIVLVHTASIRARGFRGYVHHYVFHPFPVILAPFNIFINVVEEVAKPITLALRLFGNLFSGGLMISLIAALGAWKLGDIPIGNVVTLIFAVVWKLFDVFLIGPIQAFIFTLLTILYFDTAMSTDDPEELIHVEPVPTT